MKKIRIGNDIRLKLKINGITHLDQSNIKQVRCYLIDTTFGKDEEAACKKHCRRFTREVFPEFYMPTAYNMHGCCPVAYHVNPANVCNYTHFMPDFHEYHWWPGYKGFGIYPDKFERYHQAWHPVPHHEHYEAPYVYGPDRPFEPWYLAESEVLNELNTISCIFPAKDQVRCGVYKLVVVLTLFEQGWGKYNLRTYTVDKGDVFELVDDYTGESGNITIDVDESGTPDNLIDSIDSECVQYTMIANDRMKVGEHDIYNLPYNLYVKLKDGTTMVFDPYDWRFNKLNFTSSDETILTVDQYGTIYTHDITGDADNVPITIRVYSNEDSDVYYEFEVIVKNSNTALKIGFSTAETIGELDIDDLEYYAWNKVDDYIVNNDTDGKYLWLLSAREIDDIKSSGFHVPHDRVGVQPPFYYYRSAAAILSGKMKFVINYK